MSRGSWLEAAALMTEPLPGDEAELQARVLALIEEAARTADPESPQGRFLLAFREPMVAFLEMSVRLQASNQALLAQVVALSEELEQKRRLAALGEMAASVAHEIRNPLGGIELYASLLARDLKDRPAQLELLGQVREGVRRLDLLVEELLSYTRDPEVRPRSCAVQDLLASALRFVEVPETERAGLEVRLDLGEPPPGREPEILVDPDLFVRVLVNLFENAREAMGGRGRIHLAVRTEGRTVLLAVRDQGPGIPAEILEKVFHPFTTGRPLGVGLGLSIAERIVRAHGGSIEASNPAGGGAEFRIFLPDAAADHGNRSAEGATGGEDVERLRRETGSSPPWGAGIREGESQGGGAPRNR